MKDLSASDSRARFRAAFIKHFRQSVEDSEMTKVEIAHKLGVSRPALYKYLSSDLFPRTDVIGAALQLFGGFDLGGDFRVEPKHFQKKPKGRSGRSIQKNLLDILSDQELSVEVSEAEGGGVELRLLIRIAS